MKSRCCAIYARVSTDEQDESMQLTALRELVSQRGWELKETYIDHGVSSRSIRPELERMMKDANKRRFDVSIAAPDELRPVGFIRNAAGFAFMHGQQMEQPRAVFIEGAGAAGTQDSLQRVDDFGLHKQLAERRVQGVGGRGCQYYFGVTGDFDGTLQW